MSSTILIELPASLSLLAGLQREIRVGLAGPITQRAILDALESAHPILRGTLRDSITSQRRPFIRFFACQQDFSHRPPDETLPDAVARGEEPFLIVGAIAGG